MTTIAALSMRPRRKISSGDFAELAGKRSSARAFFHATLSWFNHDSKDGLHCRREAHCVRSLWWLAQELYGVPGASSVERRAPPLAPTELLFLSRSSVDTRAKPLSLNYLRGSKSTACTLGEPVPPSSTLRAAGHSLLAPPFPVKCSTRTLRRHTWLATSDTSVVSR